MKPLLEFYKLMDLRKFLLIRLVIYEVILREFVIKIIDTLMIAFDILLLLLINTHEKALAYSRFLPQQHWLFKIIEMPKLESVFSNGHTLLVVINMNMKFAYFLLKFDRQIILTV